MRSHGQHGARRHDREGREEEEAHPVHHHGGELPVRGHGGGLLVLPHLVRDDLDLLQNEAKFPLQWTQGRRLHFVFIQIRIGPRDLQNNDKYFRANI